MLREPCEGRGLELNNDTITKSVLNGENQLTERGLGETRNDTLNED